MALMRGRTGKLLLLITHLLIISSQSGAKEPNDVNAAVFQPGQETKLSFQGDELVLYLPQDYNDINSAPVIFYYHGMGGRPNVAFFREVTDSNGYIIIGMSYANEPKPPIRRGQRTNYVKGEVKRISRLKRYLKKELKLKINDDKLFITGISKGGWFTNDVFEYRPQPWAGAVIIAAGRHSAVEHAPLKSFRDKPVYIGAGEFDPNLKAAKRAKAFLRKAGADVSFEIYEGLGHAANPHSVVLRQWLKDMKKNPQ